jgi:hypothetical protein
MRNVENHPCNISTMGIISLAHAQVHVTDFPVITVHVDELSSARIWQHKLCATYSVSVNINNYIAVFQSKYTTVFVLLEYMNQNNSWRPECALSFNLGWRILVLYPEPEARDTIY